MNGAGTYLETPCPAWARLPPVAPYRRDRRNWRRIGWNGLAQAHVEKLFRGGPIGTGCLVYVVTHLGDRSAWFLGFEKIVPSLGEWRIS